MFFGCVWAHNLKKISNHHVKATKSVQSQIHIQAFSIYRHLKKKKNTQLYLHTVQAVQELKKKNYSCHVY